MLKPLLNKKPMRKTQASIFSMNRILKDPSSLTTNSRRTPTDTTPYPLSTSNKRAQTNMKSFDFTHTDHQLIILAQKLSP